MTFYEDLSEYSYTHSDIPMINVGWLSRTRHFPVAPVAPEVISTLARIATHPENRRRGLHDCEFCHEESPIKFPVPDGNPDMAILGNGEIHVTGDNGAIYSAPTLIIHYIEAHGYHPPEDFVQAVLEKSIPDTHGDK